jgi:hypothetical protein
MSLLLKDPREIAESLLSDDSEYVENSSINEHYLHSPEHGLLTDKGWKFKTSPGEYVHDKTPAKIHYYPSEKKHAVHAGGYVGIGGKSKKPKKFESAQDAHNHAMSLAPKWNK